MPATLSLTPLTPSDYETVAKLGDTIWRAHYSRLISLAQIEYMLAGRYVPEKLAAYVNAADRWLHILHLGNKPIGYCSHAFTSNPEEMKLEQLYLLPELHGRGLGWHMLFHVEQATLKQGRNLLMLTVNKGNDTSIAFYRRAGFGVRESVVFDIGNGYVMDDYVMEKHLPGFPA